MIIEFKTPGEPEESSFNVEVTDEQLQQLEEEAERRDLTLEELFAQIFADGLKRRLQS